MKKEAVPEPVISEEKKVHKKSFVATLKYAQYDPSYIHEEAVDFDDLPEQAQLDHEHRHSCTTRLELWITDLVARHQASIWWITVVTCVIPMSVFFAIEYVQLMTKLSTIKQFTVYHVSCCSAPFLYEHVSPAPPLLVAIFFGLCVILFLCNSFMDPGRVKPYSIEMNMALEVDLRKY